MENAPKFWNFFSLVNFYSKCKMPLTFENLEKAPVHWFHVSTYYEPVITSETREAIFFFSLSLLPTFNHLLIVNNLSLSLECLYLSYSQRFTTITTNLYYHNYYYSHPETNKGETGEELIRKEYSLLPLLLLLSLRDKQYSQKYSQ